MYVYTVVDMYGNQIPQPLVTVTTNMPGAVVSPVDTQAPTPAATPTTRACWSTSSRARTRPGTSPPTWRATLTQIKSILIGADQTALVARLTLSNNITQVNNPLNYKVVVSDGYLATP